MPDLIVQIKADLTNYIANMKQAGTISATAASDITKQLAQASQATENLGGATLSASMKFQQMRSGISAARDGVLAFSTGGQAAERSLLAMGHHLTSLVNETGSVKGAFGALVSSLWGAGGLILAISLAAELWSKYTEKQDEANRSTKSYVETLDGVRQAELKGKQDGENELIRLKLLYDATQNHSLSLKDRNLAYDELDKKYPKYFTNADREKTLLGENKTAYYELATAVLAAANAKAYEEKIGENANKIFENQLKMDDSANRQEALENSIAKAKRVQDQQKIGPVDFASQTRDQIALNKERENQNAIIAENNKLISQNAELANRALDAEKIGGFKLNSELDDKNKKVAEQKTLLQELEKQLKDLQDTEAKWLQAGNKQDFFNLTKTERDINALTQKIEELKKATKEVDAPTIKFTKEVSINTSNFKSNLTGDQMQKQVADINKRNAAIEQGAQAEKDLNTEMQNQQVLVNDLGYAFNTAFNSIITGSQSAMQAVVSALEQMILRLIEAVAEAAILAGILSLLSGGTVSFVGELLGAGGTLAKGTGLVIPGHADGGITTRAHLAMVGEGREKEAIMPLSKLQNFINTNQGQQSHNGLVATITGSDLQLWDVRSKIQKGRIG